MPEIAQSSVALSNSRHRVLLSYSEQIVRLLVASCWREAEANLGTLTGASASAEAMLERALTYLSSGFGSPLQIEDRKPAPISPEHEQEEEATASSSCSFGQYVRSLVSG